MNDTRPILLVEDSDDDAELTRMAFEEAKIANPIIRASTGIAALDYLFGRGEHGQRDATGVPALILLDLKIPGIGGIDVLKAVRADARTKHLPVVILTSSDEEKDRLAAYDGYANSYVQKPVDFDQFVSASRQLAQYWMGLNRPAPGPLSGSTRPSRSGGPR
jgi:two-component system, response regulator